VKRPDATNASGVLNPTGFGSTAAEQASTDTVTDCANFSSKIAAKDIWSLDAEGIVVDKDGYFWLCEENGPTIWKLNQNGVVIKRYTPFPSQPIDVAIDTVFKYRKNNRGFEGIALAPNGKIYAIIQSPILYPTTSIGENTRVHRILEIDPTTNATRMFVYLNDGVIGSSGSNQIRLRDWKIGDMAAINDSTFLVLEAALRGTTDIKRMYKININGATNVTSGLYSGVTLEALVDSAGLAANSIVPVRKTLAMDLYANGWNPALDKAEGIAIINDSTIAFANDNDYGLSSPAANGIATPTSNLSHVITYRLQGSNKLNNFQTQAITLSLGVTGPSTGQTPYLIPTVTGATFTSILTAGETVGSYKMCGLPDGLGAFDNGDGTFTVLMNHEMGNTSGVTRAHGSTGAFVSKWIINKSTLSVISGQDLIQSVSLWNPATSSYITYNSAFPSTSAALTRFCSADLPAVSAFYNSVTGKGTPERIFMNGEESGTEGRAFGHIATGANAGKTYELPYLGKFSWENSVASPLRSDSTVVIGMDDATPGQVYIYVGTKTNTGNEIDKAGLSNGKLYGISVSGMLTETSASVPTPGTSFSLIDLGDVHNMSGSALNTNSNTLGVTSFLRPEDGAWDPRNPNDFYFVTTNAFTSPSRMWRLRFANAANPMLGGTISAVLDGTEGQKMLDNMTIDNYGHAILVEDVGGNAHLGKTWQYDIATDVLKQVGSHDSTRFLTGSANFLTQDEEASGIVDVESILGAGMFLTVDQAHHGKSGEVVEGGQLLAFFNPDSYNAAPEVVVRGNSVVITDGDNTPSSADNTQFGNVNTGANANKTFVIQNLGQGPLNVTGITFTGANAAEYSLVTPPTFPLTLTSAGAQTVTVRFAPLAGGTRTAMINIANNDADEALYNFALEGNAIDSPEIAVTGNTVNIIDGDMTPGVANNTDFGNIIATTSVTKTFVIKNNGNGNLNVSGINFSGTHAAEFTLVSAPTYPLVIPTAGSFTVTAKCTPAALGTRSATMNIMNNDADESTYDFAVQGIGVAAPEIAVKGNGIVIADGDPTAGAATNTDFGNVNIAGYATRTFLIQNQSAGILTISGVSFSGPNATDFGIVSAPSFPYNIAANDSMYITVNVVPAAVGVRNATMQIFNNDPDEGAYDFALMANGLGLPEINLQGDSVNIIDGDATAGTANKTDFSTVNIGADAAQNFVIQNTGLGSLNISGITFTGVASSEFSLSGAAWFPWNIAAGSSQSFTVKFQPTATGTRNAKINIANTDADEATYDFAIMGMGRSATGFADANANASVQVYPNPSNDVTTVAIELKNSARVTVNVTDIQGKDVVPAVDKTMSAGMQLVAINTANLANGIYFLKVSDGSSASNIKLVVMH
jgi:hypothetical protein